MGCHCVMSSVCMGRWCSLRVQGLCVTLSRKIPHFATWSRMFTSSKAGLTTLMLDTMRYATIPILQSSYAKKSTLLCSVANIVFSSALVCPVAIIVQWLMSFYCPQVTVTRWYCSNRFITLLVGWSCTKLLAYVSHMATVHVM